MIAKEDIEKAVRESFDVVKVTNVIYDEIQKAFTKGFELGVKFAIGNGTPVQQFAESVKEEE